MQDSNAHFYRIFGGEPLSGEDVADLIPRNQEALATKAGLSPLHFKSRKTNIKYVLRMHIMMPKSVTYVGG